MLDNAKSIGSKIITPIFFMSLYPRKMYFLLWKKFYLAHENGGEQINTSKGRKKRIIKGVPM